MMFPKTLLPGRKTHYDSDPAEEEGMLSKKIPNNRHNLDRHVSRVWRIITICNIGLFLCSITLFGLSRQHQAEGNPIERNKLLKATNLYSPLLEHIDIPLSTVRINATVLNLENYIYTQPPSPEVDAAWKRLANLDPIHLTSEEVSALQKDPTTTALYPESFGLGPDAYIAAPNAMHQFHCLDKLRRDIDFDYYYGDIYPDGVRSAEHRVHTSHCLYIILQQLMCAPSTDMFVFEWVEGQKAPFPDFNINQKCVHLDAIVDYHKENSVSREKVLKLRAPDGQLRAPMPDDVLRILEITGGRKTSPEN